MSELVEWLLEQIAEDERAVDRAHPYSGSALDIRNYDGDDEIIVSRGRMLAECEAKRRIIAEAKSTHKPIAAWGWDEGHSEGEWDMAQTMLRIIATAYTDREGYREEWNL